MIIKAGDEVTINGVVKEVTQFCFTIDRFGIEHPYGEPTIIVELPSGETICLEHASDINTIHPYKEPSKEDQRKGN